MVIDDKTKRNKAKYYGQKQNAKIRGIDWALTFDEWITWWGADIEKRGSEKDNLQMQRIADSGPYALWNIKKGTPKKNSITAATVARNKKTQMAKEKHEQYLNSLMFAESKIKDWIPDEEWHDPGGNGRQYTNSRHSYKRLDT